MSLLTIFLLQDYFFYISIATPTLHWLPCAWNIFPYFHFQPVCVFRSKVILLNTKYSWIIFYIHFANFCVLIGGFNLFTFKVIINQEGVILSFWYLFSICPIYFCCCPSMTFMVFTCVQFFSCVAFCFPYQTNALYSNNTHLIRLLWGIN